MIHLQVDKVLQKLTAILGVQVTPYTPGIDPTRIIKRCLEQGLQPKNMDWTITGEPLYFLKMKELTMSCVDTILICYLLYFP